MTTLFIPLSDDVLADCPEQAPDSVEPLHVAATDYEWTLELNPDEDDSVLIEFCPDQFS